MIRPGAQLVNKFFNLNRQFTRQLVLTTLPRVRAPFYVKVAEGIFMAVGILALPTYIAFNMKHYSAGIEPKYTYKDD